VQSTLLLLHIIFEETNKQKKNTEIIKDFLFFPLEIFKIIIKSLFFSFYFCLFWSKLKKRLVARKSIVTTGGNGNMLFFISMVAFVVSFFVLSDLRL
jgi:hypothetical protein